jgi:quercetin dioxygenase-like cupin family protein
MRIGELAGFIGAVGIAVVFGSATGHAHGPEQKTVIPVSQEKAGPAFDATVTPVFQRTIPNIPGRTMVALVVTYPPGGKSPAHRHAPSAFIYAHVLSGAIRSQVGDEPAKVYQVGEGFYEDPGSHHRVSENASATEPASMLAVFVVDPKDTPLTKADQQ